MDITNVPLPDQLPKKLDVSLLPKELLESQAFENLMAQNDDLMARLSVSLKRILKLEQMGREEFNKNKELHQKIEHLTDQVLILKEKSKNTIERKEETERSFTEITARLESLEKSHTDLLIKSDQQNKIYEGTIENQKILIESAEVSAQKAQHLYLRYRRRIKKYIAPGILELKSKFLDLVDDCEELKIDWYAQREKLERKIRRHTKYRNHIKQIIPHLISELKKALIAQNDTIAVQTHTIKEIETQRSHLTTALNELKGKAGETLNYISVQKQKIDEQAKIINERENQVVAQDAALTKIKAEKEELHSLVQSHQAKIVELDNHIIFYQRRIDDKNARFNKDLSEVQSIVGALKKETKEKDLSIVALNEEVEILRKINNDYKIKNSNLENEVTSLTALWNDYRLRMDELKLKEESLRALNNELMLKMKDLRENNNQLRGEQQKVVQVSENRLQILSKENEISLKQISQLESLMAEIQSGYTKKPILKDPSLPLQTFQDQDLSSP